MPCIEYKGKKYTYEEFGAMLRDGAFAKMAKSGELNIENLGAKVPSSLLEATRKTITPETSSNFANLTVDEDGNYVFFHRGAKGYTEIKPGTGQSGITPSNEAAAIGRVGGVAMYYTTPDESERMVSGDAQYAVTVAPDEVYDFNEDPENYIVEARDRFEKENPGKAFDANNQLAYITKIAGENGYKMVVAEWTNGRTRAQTTEAMKPTDVKLLDGDVIKKDFDKKYKKNKDMGWESVVPETKEDKLNKLYLKIYNERSDKNRYDDLYHLAEDAPKKTQDEITKLINESDISQELKDEYNQILGEKEQARKSKKKVANDTVAEVDRIKSVDKAAEDGATFNLDGTKYEGVGLVVPAASVNTTVEELTPEMIMDFVEQQRSKIGDDAVVKVGIYKFKNSNKVSIDLNIIAPESSRDVAIEFGRLAGQESLFDLRTFENIKTGADGKNPMKFSDKQFKEIAKALKEGKMPNVFGAQETTALDDIFNNEAIQSDVDNAISAMSEIMPELNIVVHDTYESYLEALGEAEEAESGGFFDNENTIHINKRAASDTTVAHEVFHAVLKKMLGSERAIQKKALSMVRNLSGQIKSDPKLKAALNEFVSRYTESPETMNEEAVSELFGMLNAGYAELKPVERSAIRKFIDAIAKLLGLGDFLRVKENEYVDLLNTLSQRIRTGEAITAEDVVSLKVVPANTDAYGNLEKPSTLSIDNLSKKKQNIINDTKSSVVEGKIVSTRLPKKDNVHNTSDYIVSMNYIEELAKTDKGAESQYIKIASEISSYGISKIKEVNTFEDAKESVKEFKEIVKSNLKWLYNSFGKDVRDISKLWYDGANKICNKIASETGYSIEQVSGVMAVLSPQMDWFRNLSLGERVIDIYTNQQDSVFDDKMIDYVKNASSGTGKKKTPLFKDSKELILRVKGKRFSELNNKDKAYFVRVFDEVYNSREYNNISPNGEINGLVRKGDGTPGACGWGAFPTIEKSISILQDGSINNISSNLGNMHKVRNFFNNISNPNDKNAVTIDTHAVAAGLLLPLSGSSKQVLYNFGGAGNVNTGMSGTYPVYADAYRDLAKEIGLLPREVQSITWEAVRGLFKASFKSNKNNEQKINDVWNRYGSGEISLKDVHSEISEIAGGISKPVWYEYLADDNSISMDENSAAIDQSYLDDESEYPKATKKKKQISAYHGSPYDFDRFTTSAIGTGEGAQAFGWGLYFTDLESIAKGYAKSLAKTTFAGKSLDDNPIFQKLFSRLDAENEDFYNLDKGTIHNLGKFKEYIDDMYDYLSKEINKIDENHRMVKRFLSDSEYTQEKIESARDSLRNKEDVKKIYDSLISNGVDKETSKQLIDRFERVRKSNVQFLYDALKYQSSRDSLSKKAINFVKNGIKSDLNYFKYLSENFDKFNLSRNLYEVTLFEGKTPDQYTWLEWDKPVDNDLLLKIKKIFTKERDRYRDTGKYNQSDKYVGEYYDDLLEKLNATPIKTNQDLYKRLSVLFGSDKQASLFLLENGIDGVKYPAESISRGATSDTARGFNYVVFDENAITVEERIKFQKPAISKKIEAALNSGATEQEIIDKMTQVGYTEAEAKAYIEQYNNMRSDEYARVKANIDTITKKVADRAGKNANPKVVRQRQYDDAMNYLQNSLWYENASDTEREASVREIRSDLGFREKAAPAAAKVTEGKRDTITIDSLQALAQSIRDQNRGAKAALKDLAEKRESLRVALNTLVNKAKITARQATTILNKFSKVNLNDDQAVKDLIDYVEQTYKDAEITNQVRQAAQTAKDERRGAKAALKDLAEKREALRVALKSLVTSGKITNRQASVMLNKVMSVNLNNDNAVNKLIKYIEKVYNNSEIAEKMSKANGMRRTAKKNIKSKIGSAKVAFPLLDKLFSIDSRQIPLEVLDTYFNLVNQFGKRVGVLTTDNMSSVIQDAQDVIDAINEEESRANDLAMIFDMYPDKVTDSNGEIDFNQTVKKMKDEGYIDEETAKEMDEYRTDIFKKERATKEDDAQERKDLIAEISAAKLVTSSRLADPNERKAAREIIQMARSRTLLKKLSTTSLRNLAAIMKNIDAGFFPNYGVKLMQAMQVEQQAPLVNETVSDVSLRVISTAYNRFKALTKLEGWRNNTGVAIQKTLESNMSTDLDFMLGDNKKRYIYDYVIKPLAKAYASFDTEATAVKEKMTEAVNMLEKQFNGNTNRVAESKFKMMAYMLQKEFETNPGQKGVAPAVDFINQTIKAIKARDTEYSERDIELLESIKNSYSTNGQIDMNKIFDSLSPREKKALSIVEDLNKSMYDKAIFTSGVIRGNRTQMYNNYVPHSVIPSKMSKDDKITSVSNAYNNTQAVGTKAGSLQQRTPGAKPIMFDPFLASMNSAVDVLLDFHMTIPMQTTNKLVRKVKKDLNDNPNTTNKSKDAINAIQQVRDNIARFVFTNNKYYDDSVFGALGKTFLSTMYRNTLGSVPRFANELISNFSYVIANPKNWATGLKHVFKDSDYINGVSGRDIMTSVGSTVTGKLYGKNNTGKFSDIGFLGSDNASHGSKSKNAFENTKDIISRYTKKPLAELTEYVGEKLISTPDMLMSKPIWFGAFANEFKKQTGTDVDFSKLTDERYKNKYKAAIDAATDYADNEVIQSGSTVNPFQKAAKMNVDQSAPVSRKLFAQVNNYLTNFMITEFSTARAAAYSLVTEGRLPKAKAAGVMTGVYMRIVMYTLLSNAMAGVFYGALGYDDDDEETTTWDDIVQAATGGFVSLLVNRNFGNLFKMVENYGVEKLNEEYGDMLRSGEEYDPYKHSLAFNKIKEKDIARDPAKFATVTLAGPYAMPVKTAWKINDLIEYEGRYVGKNAEQKIIQKEKDYSIGGVLKKKRMEKTKDEVLFNIAAGSGLVPFAKDIRPIISGVQKKKGEN